MSNILKTLHKQLGRKFETKIGATNIVYDGYMIYFNVSPHTTKNHINKIWINQCENGTYRVAVGTVEPKTLKLSNFEEEEGVGMDDLQRVFTKLTGIDTSV